MRYGSLGTHPEPDNVRAFDRDGSLRWTAEPVHVGTGTNAYVGLRVEDGELWAPDWKGTDHRLDLDTGEQIDSVFRK